jgi:hypothetical protein
MSQSKHVSKEESSEDSSGIFDKLGELLERMKGADYTDTTREEKNRAKQDPSPPPPPTNKSGSRWK